MRGLHMSDLRRNTHCIGCGSKLRASDDKDYHNEDCYEKFLKIYTRDNFRFIEMSE